MKIAYMCMDSNVSLTKQQYAPTIHITSTIKALEDLGHDVTPFLYGDGLGQSEAALRERFKGRRTSHPALRLARRASSDLLLAYQDLAKDRDRIERFLRDTSADVVYERLYQPRSVVTRVAAKLDIPVIVESNAPAEERQTYWGSPLHGLMKKKELAILDRAAAVVVMSTPLMNHYVDIGVTKSKIHVLPNAVDNRRFSPDSVTRNVRGELALGDAVVVGFVGNIHPYHGGDLFVPLARKFQSEGRSVRILVVGAGPNLSTLAADLESAGLTDQVLTTGAVPHDSIPAYIAAMDICLLPNFSWYGSAMKLLEYAAMGKTVMAPDLENVRDVFSHGQDAYLFPQGDIDALAGGLDDLIAQPDLRLRLGAAARHLVVNHHTWKHNAKRIVGIIEGTTG